MSTNETLDTASRPRTRWKSIVTNQQFVLFAVLIALIAYFGKRNSLFFHPGEFSNLFTDFSGLVLIAIAETYVIIAGGIDLAVGSTAALSGVVTAGWIQPLVTHGTNEAIVLLAGAGLCVLVGPSRVALARC